MNKEDLYCLGFSLSNLGPKRFVALLNKFGSSEIAWGGTKAEYKELGIKDKGLETFDEFRSNFDIDIYISKLQKEGVDFISYRNKRYPKDLKKLENPPIGLFCKGNTTLLSEPLKIAVVGTRKMTMYGKSVTEGLSGEMVVNGVCIISGLALGIDATAHRAAIFNQGKTIAVLACGVDCCNPSENYSLYKKIIEEEGCVVSEYPLSCPPNKGTFLARNRIIAALSDGVLVTEAAIGSGSLVTADWGLKLGRKVFAVPGPINSQMAAGSLKLLKQGARVVTEAGDILEEFKIQKSKVKITNKKLKNLNSEEKKIVALLESEELTIDEISKKTRLPVTKLFVSMSNLELKGILKNTGGKIRLIM